MNLETGVINDLNRSCFLMDIKEFEKFLMGLSREKFITGNIFFYDNFTEIFWADNSSESITTQITRPVKQKNGYSADFEISDGELTINYYKDDQEIVEKSEQMSSMLIDNFFVMAYIGVIITFVFLNTFLVNSIN